MKRKAMRKKISKRQLANDRVAQIRPFIAYERHFSCLKISEIAYKYGVCESTAIKARNMYSKNDVKKLKREFGAILIVHPDDARSAKEILESKGIDCEMAAPKSELIQTFESKLNN